LYALYAIYLTPHGGLKKETREFLLLVSPLVCAGLGTAMCLPFFATSQPHRVAGELQLGIVGLAGLGYSLALVFLGRPLGKVAGVASFLPYAALALVGVKRVFGGW